MFEIPHIAYNGDSKIIKRLCQTVNALIDADVTVEVDDALSDISENPVQNQAIATALNALSAQISAIQETIGVSPGAIAASVENDILVLTGAGASVRGNHLLLLSPDGASVSGDILYM